MLENLTPDNFSEILNENFVLRITDHEDMNFELLEVNRMPHGRREGGSFSLLFSTVSEPLLNQGVLPLTHEKLGTLQIFLVPVGPLPDKPDSMSYEAIFS
ncbi:MAG: hypothetical protein AAF423_02525 [Pseudomonadota bacterium]